ncbi:VWA domain-containing protein [Paenibacillus sp. SYP-B3998]|uniref:VWA domain-containing protein n=1 Tax=Paenibacillus sp. SYP-B3998 TaxID=2678564 RepID=A0A6G3ZUH2_9BACL|nr:VWA domain-containing protein [Paenibacillus sp. SYP-B3998]NEW05239.1 VWA domain-containing protein [Paenibacillus sp. SYP-B3998]
MHFASLGGLWFLLSLPFIVFLYLLKRRYVDTEVSSHLLWQRVLREQEANRPWQSLRRQLLLWLQLLAACLFVFALMQPFIQTKPVAKAHVVFILDASASMMAADAQSTRFEQAKAALIDYARVQAPHSLYTLLVIKDQPEVLLKENNDASSLQSAINKVTPFYGNTNYEEALSLASALTRDETNGEVHMFTDLQWTEQANDMFFTVPFTVHPSQATPVINASVTQFGIKSVADSSRYQAVAALKNWGGTPVSLKTTVFIDGQAAKQNSLELQAGEQKSMFVDGLAQGLVYKMQIDTIDGLQADNAAYAFPEGKGRVEAAYIGEGNLFLEKALALAHVDMLNIQQSTDGTYPLPLGRRPDLLIIDGVEPSTLEGDAWKRILASTPVWRLASAHESAKGESVGSPYTIVDHPITRYLRLQDMRVISATKRALSSWEKPIVLADTLPLIAAGSDEGIPKLTFAFSLQHSDFALRSEFPILVNQAVDWLTQSQGGSLGRWIAGERKEVSLHPETVKAVWKRESELAEEVPAERNGDGVSTNQEAPDKPGLYRFIETNKGGNVVQSRLLGVSMDPRESNVNNKVEFKPNSVNNKADEGVQFKQEIVEVPILPWIIVTLLILLLLEWEVYRRGHTV